jgi:hypothetical protein
LDPKLPRAKFPNNKARNGEFYTVPVKMVFKDRITAQTAADLLRTYFKIYPTTPYHKSLRAAITQDINKAKEANPGNHAKVNVDLTGKTLKCFIREDTNPPGKWTALDIRIPIPTPALDPGLRDISKVILPTSPNDPCLGSNGLSKTRATDNRAKPTFDNNKNSEESMDTGDTGTGTEDNMVNVGNLQKKLEKVNAELSPLPAFMNTPKGKNSRQFTFLSRQFTFLSRQFTFLSRQFTFLGARRGNLSSRDSLPASQPASASPPSVPLLYPPHGVKC